MNNCLSYTKSKYPMNKNNIIETFFFVGIIIISMLGWRLYLYRFLDRSSLVIFIYIISLICYWKKYVKQKKRISNAEYISENARKCLNRVKKCVICKVIFVVITFYMTCVVENSKDIVNISMLIYIIIMGIMLTNYPFIVIFGKDRYFSGEGEIEYKDIMKIDEIRQQDVVEGKMIYAQIETKEGVLCYDKFLVSEYIYLSKRIIQSA